MVSKHLVYTFALLAGSAAASPRWWAYQGPGSLSKTKRAADPFPEPRHPHRHGRHSSGIVSSGVLYLTTTVTLPPGQTAPAAVVTPPIQPSLATPPSVQQPASPPAAVQAPASQAPVASPSTLSTAAKPSTAPAQQVQAPAQTSKAAAPASSSVTTPLVAPNNAATVGSITADMIIKAAPDSSSCSGAPFADECATAAQAAPALTSAFSKYGISNAGAQAAVLAWEIFESGSFKYKINHYPGRPGQGTRCMMMPNFVSEYATAVVGAAQVSAAGSDPAAVLDLVNGDDAGSFGGGAWFMSAKCSNLVSQFATSPDAAWSSFMGSCVGVASPDSARDAVWNSAKAALGVA